MTIIRRFEYALEENKAKVLAKYDNGAMAIPKVLCKEPGYQFYNVSNFNLKELLSSKQLV